MNTSELAQDFEARLSESSTIAYRVAVGVLRHREDAEDVSQEALAKAYRSFGQIREPERFRAWLGSIAWRLALNHLRADKRRGLRKDVELEVSRTETAMEALVAREQSQLLWQAIESLPEKYRVVTVMAGIHERRLREIAILLSLPAGTVKKRLFVARQLLRQFFIDQGLAGEMTLKR